MSHHQQHSSSQHHTIHPPGQLPNYVVPGIASSGEISRDQIMITSGDQLDSNQKTNHADFSLLNIRNLMPSLGDGSELLLHTESSDDFQNKSQLNPTFKKREDHPKSQFAVKGQQIMDSSQVPSYQRMTNRSPRKVKKGGLIVNRFGRERSHPTKKMASGGQTDRFSMPAINSIRASMDKAVGGGPADPYFEEYSNLLVNESFSKEMNNNKRETDRSSVTVVRSIQGMSFGPAVNQVTAYGTGIIREPHVVGDLNQDLLTVSSISKNHPNLLPPAMQQRTKPSNIFGGDLLLSQIRPHDEYSSHQRTERHNSEVSVIPPLDSMVISSNMPLEAKGSIDQVQTNTHSFRSNGNALNSLPVNLPSSGAKQRNQNISVAVHRKRLRKEAGLPTDSSCNLSPTKLQQQQQESQEESQQVHSTQVFINPQSSINQSEQQVQVCEQELDFQEVNDPEPVSKANPPVVTLKQKPAEKATSQRLLPILKKEVKIKPSFVNFPTGQDEPSEELIEKKSKGKHSPNRKQNQSSGSPCRRLRQRDSGDLESIIKPLKKQIKHTRTSKPIDHGSLFRSNQHQNASQPQLPTLRHQLSDLGALPKQLIEPRREGLYLDEPRVMFSHRSQSMDVNSFYNHAMAQKKRHQLTTRPIHPQNPAGPKSGHAGSSLSSEASVFDKDKTKVPPISYLYPPDNAQRNFPVGPYNMSALQQPSTKFQIRLSKERRLNLRVKLDRKQIYQEALANIAQETRGVNHFSTARTSSLDRPSPKGMNPYGEEPERPYFNHQRSIEFMKRLESTPQSIQVLPQSQLQTFSSSQLPHIDTKTVTMKQALSGYATARDAYEEKILPNELLREPKSAAIVDTKLTTHSSRTPFDVNHKMSSGIRTLERPQAESITEIEKPSSQSRVQQSNLRAESSNISQSGRRSTQSQLPLAYMELNKEAKVQHQVEGSPQHAQTMKDTKEDQPASVEEPVPKSQGEMMRRVSKQQSKKQPIFSELSKIPTDQKDIKTHNIYADSKMIAAFPSTTQKNFETELTSTVPELIQDRTPDIKSPKDKLLKQNDGTLYERFVGAQTSVNPSIQTSFEDLNRSHAHDEIARVMALLHQNDLQEQLEKEAQGANHTRKQAVSPIKTELLPNPLGDSQELNGSATMPGYIAEEMSSKFGKALPVGSSGEPTTRVPPPPHLPSKKTKPAAKPKAQANVIQKKIAYYRSVINNERKYPSKSTSKRANEDIIPTTPPDQTQKRTKRRSHFININVQQRMHPLARQESSIIGRSLNRQVSQASNLSPASPFKGETKLSTYNSTEKQLIQNLKDYKQKVGDLGSRLDLSGPDKVYGDHQLRQSTKQEEGSRSKSQFQLPLPTSSEVKSESSDMVMRQKGTTQTGTEQSEASPKKLLKELQKLDDPAHESRGIGVGTGVSPSKLASSIKDPDTYLAASREISQGEMSNFAYGLKLNTDNKFSFGRQSQYRSTAHIDGSSAEDLIKKLNSLGNNNAIKIHILQRQSDFLLKEQSQAMIKTLREAEQHLLKQQQQASDRHTSPRKPIEPTDGQVLKWNKERIKKLVPLGQQKEMTRVKEARRRALEKKETKMKEEKRKDVERAQLMIGIGQLKHKPRHKPKEASLIDFIRAKLVLMKASEDAEEAAAKASISPSKEAAQKSTVEPGPKKPMVISTQGKHHSFDTRAPEHYLSRHQSTEQISVIDSNQQPSGGLNSVKPDQQHLRRAASQISIQPHLQRQIKIHNRNSSHLMNHDSLLSVYQVQYEPQRELESPMKKFRKHNSVGSSSTSSAAHSPSRSGSVKTKVPSLSRVGSYLGSKHVLDIPCGYTELRDIEKNFRAKDVLGKMWGQIQHYQKFSFYLGQDPNEDDHGGEAITVKTGGLDPALERPLNWRPLVDPESQTVNPSILAEQDRSVKTLTYQLKFVDHMKTLVNERHELDKKKHEKEGMDHYDVDGFDSLLSVNLIDEIEAYRQKVKAKVCGSAEADEDELVVLERFIYENYEVLINPKTFLSSVSASSVGGEDALTTIAIHQLGNESHNTFDFKHKSQLFEPHIDGKEGEVRPTTEGSTAEKEVLAETTGEFNLDGQDTTLRVFNRMKEKLDNDETLTKVAFTHFEETKDNEADFAKHYKEYQKNMASTRKMYPVVPPKPKSINPPIWVRMETPPKESSRSFKNRQDEVFEKTKVEIQRKHKRQERYERLVTMKQRIEGRRGAPKMEGISIPKFKPGLGPE